MNRPTRRAPVDHTYALGAIADLLDRHHPHPTASSAALGVPAARTSVVQAVLAEWLHQHGYRYDHLDVDAAATDASPHGFTALLDWAIAAEEHRLRVG